MKFTVNITRISYSSREFNVEAENEEQASQEALDLAYNTSFEEENAEYEIESCTEEP